MPKGVPDGRNEPGWLDIGEYLAELRSTSGINWAVCVSSTGGQSKERAILLAMCEYRGGAPIVRDDIAITAGAWPSLSYRSMESAVFDLLYRFDRRLAEREEAHRQLDLF